MQLHAEIVARDGAVTKPGLSKDMQHHGMESFTLETLPGIFTDSNCWESLVECEEEFNLKVRCHMCSVVVVLPEL